MYTGSETEQHIQNSLFKYIYSDVHEEVQKHIDLSSLRTNRNSRIAFLKSVNSLIENRVKKWVSLNSGSGLVEGDLFWQYNLTTCIPLCLPRKLQSMEYGNKEIIFSNLEPKIMITFPNGNLHNDLGALIMENMLSEGLEANEEEVVPKITDRDIRDYAVSIMSRKCGLQQTLGISSAASEKDLPFVIDSLDIEQVVAEMEENAKLIIELEELATKRWDEITKRVLAIKIPNLKAPWDLV